MLTCTCCDPGAAAAADAAEAADPTPAMGLLPAAPGCRCHLCLPPGDPLDASDTRSLRTVERYGWQVVAVFDARPAFAYTVGLPHRVGHPELVMSGLDPSLMQRCLNTLAGRVLDGARLEAGHVAEGVLAGVPVLLERLRPAALADTVTGSRWFHRRRVQALQLVWPDRQARFGWQPGAATDVRSAQPASWRFPAGRTGMLAPDPVWPWATPPEAPALGCRHVVEEGAATVHARRALDSRGADTWTFSCGAAHVGAADLRTAHLSHLVRAAPSLADLAGLLPGGRAERTGPGAPWVVLPGRVRRA